MVISVVKFVQIMTAQYIQYEHGDVFLITCLPNCLPDNFSYVTIIDFLIILTIVFPMTTVMKISYVINVDCLS